MKCQFVAKTGNRPLGGLQMLFGILLGWGVVRCLFQLWERVNAIICCLQDDGFWGLAGKDD